MKSASGKNLEALFLLDFLNYTPYFCLIKLLYYEKAITLFINGVNGVSSILFIIEKDVING